MGRPTDAMRHKFKEILESDSGVAKFKRIMAALEDPDTYLAYFKEAADRGFGRSIQSVEMDVNDSSQRPTREQLDAALRSLNGHSEGNGMEAGK